jgi:S-DNA-T family DNA segregation ATPase FtsK/SpoIIIE
MLYTNGNDVVESNVLLLTPLIEKSPILLVHKAYDTAYLLPEFMGEDSGILM